LDEYRRPGLICSDYKKKWPVERKLTDSINAECMHSVSNGAYAESILDPN